MPETPQSELNDAGALTKMLLDTLDQMVDRVLGKQTVDKDGKPLRQVAYMHMPSGLPIDARQYANPWSPAGGATLQGMAKDGTLPKLEPTPAPATAPVAGSPPPVPPKPTQDPKLMASMQAALNTTWLFDDMPMVTSDGTYRPYPSSRKLSSAYEGLIHTLQAVPPPPQSPEVVKALKDAEAVLYNHDADGNITGPTPTFQNWLKFSQAYADAKAEFARQESIAMTDPVFGAAWPVTAASAQQKVDNAYRIWRSSRADAVEKALDTMNSVGGSAAAHFVSQARELFDKWDLSLAGVVAVKTPYTQITPGSWYDRTNEDGYATITVSSEDTHSSASSQSSSFANSWYHGSTSSTQAGGSGSFFGISVGGHGGSSSSHSSSEGHEGGQESSQHEDRTTSASITMQFGVAKIERPAILTEILHIGGWYIPGDKAGCVSDGTIAGQAGDDKKLLPMITTEALIIGDVEITATGWGASGQALSDHYENQKAQTDSSSWNAGGSVGFCGFGGSVDHSESEWSGSASNDANASWGFKYDAFSDKGTLTIKGRQVAGYVGEIVGMNPRIDDPNLGKDKDKPKAEGAAATSNGDAATPAPDGTAATPAADATGATTNGDPAATPTVPAGGQA